MSKCQPAIPTCEFSLAHFAAPAITTVLVNGRRVPACQRCSQWITACREWRLSRVVLPGDPA